MPGIIVGSVSVSIVPDAGRFGPDLKAALAAPIESIGKQISQQIANAIRDGMSNAPTSEAARTGASAGGTFADSFKARVEAALAHLPDIEVGADTSNADVHLQALRVRLEALANTRLDVDMDTATAVAELDRIKAELDEMSAQSPNVRVKADTAAAAAKLAELQAQIAEINGEHADVDVSDGGSAGAVSGDLFGLSTLLIGLVPLAAPVGAALVAALMGVATAAAAALGGIGVLALGIMAVSKAVGLLGQQQKAQAGTALASSASQVNSAAQVAQAERALAEARANADNQAITSAEQVKNARLALSQARKDAARQDAAAIDQISQAEQNAAAVSRQVAQQQAQDARSVVDAEHNLAEAARSSANAQQQLNDAREQAARDLESYANNAVDSNLNLQQSKIDLTNAQAQYQADQANQAVTPTQLQQDALNVAKAQQSVVEAQERLAQATEDNNKAQAEGVDNAPGVLSAQQNLADALYAQQQAEQSLTDTQNKQAQDRVAGAQQIFDAEQKIREAATARAQAEVKGAQQVLKAEQAVTDALRAQAAQRRQSEFSISNAQAGLASARRPPSVSAGGGGTGSIASIDAQIAATNPAVLAFAKFVRATLMPAFNDLSDVAAGGLMPGVEKGFKAFLPVLPLLTGFVGSLARTMGDLFAQAGKALNSPFWRQFFGYVSATAGPTLVTMAKIVGNLAKGFAGLMEAFAPVTKSIGDGILKLARGFASFGTGSGSGAAPFLQFMTYVKTEGPKVADMFGKLFVLFGHIVVALAPLGDVLVKVIGGFASLLDTLSPNQLMVAMIGIGALISLISGPVGIAVAVVAAAALIARNWGAIKQAFIDVWDWMKSTWSILWAGVKNYVVSPVKSAYDAVAGFFGKNGTMRQVFTDIWDWIKGAWSTLWSGAKKIYIQPYVDAYNYLAGLFGKGGAVRSIFTDVWGWISGAFSSLWSGARHVLIAPVNAARDTFSSLFGPKGTVRTIFNDFVSGVETIWDKLEAIFKKPITFLINTVLNDGLIGAWDWIADKIPGASGLSIKPIKLPKGWAGGGVLPGYAPGVDSIPAMLSPGEGVLVPEAVRGIGGGAGVHALNSMFSSRARFADGGVAGVLGSINPLSWISDFVGKIKGVYSGLSQLGTSPVGKIIEAMPKALGSQMIDYVKSIPSDVWGAITGAVSGIIHGIGSLFGGGSSPSGSARSIGQKMAASLGWTGSQWSDLDALWNRESGWNYRATNPSSGAYGIPQSLPASKMASAGADWMSNPATQIKWGLGYIAGRYGNPVNAWAHELAFNWYDQGGLLPPGPSLTYNGTRGDELVAPKQTFKDIIGNASGGDVNVQVFIGDEAIDPRFVKIAHGVVTGRAFAAQQDQRARRSGTTADLLVKNGPR